MRAHLQTLSRPLTRSGPPVARAFTSSALSPYGRTAPFRRIHSQIQRSASYNEPLPPFLTSPLAIISPFCPLFQPPAASSISRPFTSATLHFQQQQPKEEVRDPPRQDESSKANGESSSDSKSSSTDQEGNNDQKQDDSSSKDRQQKKEAPPPPPPHGDKSPWQVFTETLKSEFKASKEWNESTKALASSAHQFTENESVKRARAAYSSASSATTSATSSALKGTGKVLGQGAAWTWDTAAVKGVRAGVNATGRGLEKATRPVRETKVYKTAVGGVKDVIDDGSSSRYGGWVEKEERRKQRELREAQEAVKTAGTPGAKPDEKIEEDPKYVFSICCPFPPAMRPEKFAVDKTIQNPSNLDGLISSAYKKKHNVCVWAWIEREPQYDTGKLSESLALSHQSDSLDVLMPGLLNINE